MNTLRRARTPARRAVGLVLIVPLLVAAFPALLAGDCGRCPAPVMKCCSGKNVGCGERERPSERIEPLGCCAPRELPKAPATDSIPVPAADRLQALSTVSAIDAVRPTLLMTDDRSAPKLPHAVPLFTFHSVLLI